MTQEMVRDLTVATTKGGALLKPSFFLVKDRITHYSYPIDLIQRQLGKTVAGYI